MSTAASPSLDASTRGGDGSYVRSPVLTVAANIAFPLRIARVPKEERDGRTLDVAVFARIAPPRAGEAHLFDPATGARLSG